MTSQPPSPISLADRYNHVRGQIEHEDNLIAQRLNWFLTSQSFLFTAFAILKGYPPHSVAMFLKIIPLIAIAAGVLLMLSILAGLMVMGNLRREYSDWRAAAREAGYPPLQGSCATRLLGTLAPVVLPLTFVTAWIMLISRVL